ncbi:hypothetical protein [Haladaptatus sp. CMAA 1911]|uniref:hypothetical protein n=1 Tax=unclassified Haladaptatus TaxID=2622732 RepID=UPI003754DF99
MPGSRIGLNKRVATSLIFLILFGLLIVQPGFLTPQSRGEPRPKGPSDVRLVSPNPNSSAKLWPFTSRQERYDSLTLPINVVVEGDSSRVVNELKHRRDAQWNNDSNEWQGVANDEGTASVGKRTVEWHNTTGAVRYTYIQAPGSRGGWTTETAQLHDGAYFGSRYHLRLYEGGKGTGTWTAIQAHHEYFDWFRLRHTVGSLEKAQYYLDGQYYGKWYVDGVSRQRYANGGIIDSNGWVSIVDLRPKSEMGPVPAALMAVILLGSVDMKGTVVDSIRTLVSRLERKTVQRGIAFSVSLFGLPLFVRTASIAVETAVPSVPIKAIAGAGYLVLAFGLPLAAISLPSGRQSTDWFAIAILALGLGFLLDYRSIGVNVLPITVVVHRLAVLCIVGVLAVGGSCQETDGRWNTLVQAGLVMWVGVLVWPLLDAV